MIDQKELIVGSIVNKSGVLFIITKLPCDSLELLEPIAITKDILSSMQCDFSKVIVGTTIFEKSPTKESFIEMAELLGLKYVHEYQLLFSASFKCSLYIPILVSQPGTSVS